MNNIIDAIANDLCNKVSSMAEFMPTCDGRVDDVKMRIDHAIYDEFSLFCLDESLRLSMVAKSSIGINNFRKWVQPGINEALVRLQQCLVGKIGDTYVIGCSIKACELIIINHITEQSDYKWRLAYDLFPRHGIPFRFNSDNGLWSVIWPNIIAQQVDSAEASTIAVPPSNPSGSPR